MFNWIINLFKKPKAEPVTQYIIDNRYPSELEKVLAKARMEQPK